MTKKKHPRIFVLNDPYPLRISGELAEEIGFNESIIFLQIEFLISISDKVIDGRVWTYDSLENLKAKYFKWWSIATISRILKKLESLELIIIGNHNRHGYDRTQWFALNYEGCSKLNSVRIDDAHFSKCKMEDDNLKNALLQDETTIPETPTETPTIDGASPEAASEQPNSRKADDFLPPAEKQMELLLGSLTNPDGGPRYDQAEKDLLASGWNIRSKPIKDAAIHFLAATGWEVPSAVGIRRDWIKSLEEHITEFGIAGLYAMYSEVIQTATHRLSRPGSFTKAMAAIKNARSSDRKHVADDWMTNDPQYQTFAALPETEEVSWAAFLNPASER